jgi:cellulose synthase operon protein C
VLLVSLVGFSGREAAAEDWQVRRSEFDPRVVARYKELLSHNPNDAPSLARLVELYQKHRSLAALVGEYRTLARSQPKSFAAQVVLGHLYLRSKNEALALEQYSAAAKLQPAQASLQVAIGGILEKQGHPEEAAAAYERALSLTRGEAGRRKLLRTLAGISLSQGNLAAARVHYEKLLGLEPKNAALRKEFAQALGRGGAEKESIAQYRLLLKGQGDSAARAELLKEIGELHAKLGDQPEAVAAFKEAMALSARGHYLRQELTDRIISLYRQKDDLKALIVEYEKAWKTRGAFEHDILGRLYDETGDEEKALASYRASLRAAPYNLDTRARLIAVLDRSGRNREALDEHRRLAAAAPGEPRYTIELAKRLYQAGLIKEAIQTLDRCGQRFAGEASVHSVLADLYSRWGERAKAMKSSQVLVRVEPDDPSHLVSLGEQLYQQGQKKKALETWRRVLVVVPKKQEAHAKLAEVYAQHDLVPEAIESYRKAIQLSPKNLDYRRGLAQLHERKRDSAQALVEWEKILALAQAAKRIEAAKEARGRIIDLLNGTYQLRGRILAQQRRFESTPPDLEAGFFLAEAYAKLGETEKSDAVYRKILELDEKSLAAMTALEASYRKQRKLALAVELLKRMAAVDPTRARDHFQRIAELLLQLFRDQEALEYANRAVALGSQDATSYRKLGELFEKKEDYEAAIRAYAKAIELNPSRFGVHFSLARLHLLRGRTAEAERLLRQVLKSAKTPEVIEKAYRHVVDLSEYLGTLESLEKDLLPLVVGNPNAETYRQVLVRIYLRRVPLLVLRTREGDAAARRRAREELERIGTRGLAPLLEELAASSANRAELVRILGFLGNPNAMLPLLRIAEEQPAEEITILYANGSGSSPYSLGYGGLRYAPYSSSTGGGSVGQVALQLEAVVAIGRLASERAVPGLGRLIASREGHIRAAAAWALARTGSRAVIKTLTAALGDPSTVVQTMACAGLGATRAPELRALLEEVVLDPERRDPVRAACAWGLGALGSAASVDMLLEVMRSGDDELQRCAAWSLGRLGDARAIPELARLLWSKRPRVRDAVVWALGALDRPPRRGGGGMVPVVSVKNGRLETEEFVPGLTEEVNELRGDQRARSLASLVIGHGEPIATGLAEALGRHRDVALRALADLDEDPGRATLGTLTEGRSSLSRRDRDQLDAAMDLIGARISAGVAALLGHRDLQVRLKAISVYAKIAPREAVRPLSAAVFDPVFQVRVQALTSLERLVDKEGVSRRALSGLARKILEGRQQATPLAVGPGAPAGAALSERGGEEGRRIGYREREAAVRLLASLRDDAAAPLLEHASRDVNAFVRQAAVEAIGGRRSLGTALLAPLLLAADDEVPHVRAAACRGLGRLGLEPARRRLERLRLDDPSALVRIAAAAALDAPR